MFKFFRTYLLALVIGVAFFQGCLTNNHEINYHRIASVIALPNPVTLRNCSTTIFCIIKSIKQPDIYWTSNFLGMIDDTNMTSVNHGLGSTFISELNIRHCYRNATYSCYSHYANRTEMGSVKVTLKIEEWECLDDSDCKVYPGSKCEEYACMCKNTTPCVGINSPPVINAVKPFGNDPTMNLNHCHKLLICEAQGYNMSISWGMMGRGMFKLLGEWHETNLCNSENGITIGKITILKCLKKATFFCQAANYHGITTRNITIRMKFEKYQCWDNTDCAKYNGICTARSCYCKNGQQITLNNCSATETSTEARKSSLSQGETNAIIISSILGAILITNLIIFIIYRVLRKRTKSTSTEYINSTRY